MNYIRTKFYKMCLFKFRHIWNRVQYLRTGEISPIKIDQRSIIPRLKRTIMNISCLSQPEPNAHSPPSWHRTNRSILGNRVPFAVNLSQHFLRTFLGGTYLRSYWSATYYRPRDRQIDPSYAFDRQQRRKKTQCESCGLLRWRCHSNE